MGKDVKDIIGINDLKENKVGLGKALVAEFLGTALLVFFGCGAAAAGLRTNEFQVEFEGVKKRVLSSEFITQVSFTFGLIVACVAQAIGHISGGHINPAVTVGILVSGGISVIRGILYILVQFAGGIVGAFGVLIITNFDKGHGLGANGLQHGVTVGGGFLVEFVVTFLLVLVVFGCCDERRTDVKGSVPLAIGLAVGVAHLLSIGYTGAGLNPARSFGPMVANPDNFNSEAWIYFVAPFAGGATAGLLYTFLFSARGTSDSADF